MRRLVIGSLAVSVLAVVAPSTQSAQAHPDHHFDGGCEFAVLSDTLPTEPLGGRDQWTGEASAVFTAKDASTGLPTPTDSISFRCSLWRNTTWLGDILSGSGIGIAADADPVFGFTAWGLDTIQVCEEVAVAGETHGDADVYNAAWCHDAERSTGGLGTATRALTLIVSTLNNLPFTLADSVIICPTLQALGPVVNGIDPTIVFIYPDGDLDLFETPFWDCPPYTGELLAEPALMVLADLDDDGDLESVIGYPASSRGTTLALVPEIVDGSECDLLPGPLNSMCSSIPWAVYAAGTSGNIVASLDTADLDADGELEVVVLGAGDAPPADIDLDGDADITWTGDAESDPGSLMTCC